MKYVNFRKKSDLIQEYFLCGKMKVCREKFERKKKRLSDILRKDTSSEVLILREKKCDEKTSSPNLIFSFLKGLAG